jgi:hypothetical protein
VTARVVRKCRPDFLIRFASGEMLVLEAKGQHSEQDQIKPRFLGEWVKAITITAASAGRRRTCRRTRAISRTASPALSAQPA